ncbi:hypothetical protein [uncultured Megasphaera sp.]|uniref:hypothetical protein n=1 Tax=uncultured Megasphaera sp. TaxID=165188 RepID=UPI00259201D5|nr:hypothetical protein [uncultured Megasphaera sp.]
MTYSNYNRLSKNLSTKNEKIDSPSLRRLFSAASPKTHNPYISRRHRCGETSRLHAGVSYRYPYRKIPSLSYLCKTLG